MQYNDLGFDGVTRFHASSHDPDADIMCIKELVHSLCRDGVDTRITLQYILKPPNSQTKFFHVSYCTPGALF